MSEFLNVYCKKNQNRDKEKWDDLGALFKDVIHQFYEAIKDKNRLFRPVRGFNVAAFEACTVGLARALKTGRKHSPLRLAELYTELFTRGEFKDFIFASTSDVTITASRLRIATEVFSKE
jgi:hypothetical protein